jgi:hypothetical protein
MQLSSGVNEPTAYPPRLGAKGCVALYLLLLILIPVLILDACVSRDVVARAPSPDGKIVARLFEINGGATTSFGYVVHVSRAWPRWDHEVASVYGALRSECASGLNMRWRDGNTLVLEFLEAKDVTFDGSVQVAGRTVNVIPKAQVNDPKAPCGGMLYNQEGRPHDRN